MSPEELTAEIERLKGLLCLADEVVMETHGCFPLDVDTPRARWLREAMTLIRAETGEDYRNRQERAFAAMPQKTEGRATWAS